MKRSQFKELMELRTAIVPTMIQMRQPPPQTLLNRLNFICYVLDKMRSFDYDRNLGFGYL